jgi:hypothetical protein
MGTAGDITKTGITIAIAIATDTVITGSAAEAAHPHGVPVKEAIPLFP